MMNISETGWFENMVELIDSGLECSLNSVVDPEGEIMYIVENDGSLEDFRNYQSALESYTKIAHKKLMNQ